MLAAVAALYSVLTPARAPLPSMTATLAPPVNAALKLPLLQLARR